MTRKERYAAMQDTRFGPPPPQALALQKDFATGRQAPFDYLQHQLGSDQIQAHELAISLAAAKSEIFGLPRRDRVREYKAKGFSVAAPVLQRIWHRPELWIRLTETSEALFAICWFAVAEGLDDIIMQWIQIDLSSDAAALRQVQDFHGHRIGLWRANILRSLVDAQALQAESCMDSALSSVLHFERYDPFQASPDPLNDTVPPQSQPGTVERDGVAITKTVIRLIGHLGVRTSRISFDTSSILFEQFIGMIRRMENPWHDTWAQTGHLQLHYNIGDLLLCHPKEPDPYPFLQFLDQVTVQRNGVNRVVVPEGILNGVRHCMKRAHAILNAGRDYENADLLAQLCQNTYGTAIGSYENNNQYRLKMVPGWNRTLKRP
ncbi:hypothetical protein HII31_03902 [Pseudocercospora fuligena]|uniref:Uncharacterized protein n=1 Tax=Pseudocercospora fuligena TaxID=685502 RepID=A0A8H6RPF8_9PEZI|nr:hypothetical protein HII31_03902 [Pseudocercospora fuligena]